MRLVVGALASTLVLAVGAPVRAENVPPEHVRPAASATYSKVPLRVVRVMPESRQALLFDRSRNTHVLVETGGNVDGYVVESIDDDEVTLRLDGKQIVLAAPERAPERTDRRDRESDGVHVRSAATARSTDTPVGDPAPVDPYGEPPIRVVRAPDAPAPPLGDPGTRVGEPGSRAIEPGEGGVRVAQAPASPGAASPSPGAPAAGSGPTGPISPGDDGVRVVSATGGTATPSAPSPVAPRGEESPGIRVVQAPPGATPAGPADASGIRVVQAPVPATANGSPSAATPSAPNAGSASPSTTAPSTTGSSIPIEKTAEPTGSSTAARGASARTTPRAPATRAPGARASVTAADRRTDDARAIADMLAGGSTRAARVPALGSSSREPAAGPAAPPAATTPPRPVPADAIVLSRGDVDHALGDFASLAAAIHGSFSASGLMVDSVGEDSIFRRAGVRAGDVIASVDGAKLQSLDDAANVYARAPTANALTVQIVRDGKPMTLHVVIR